MTASEYITLIGVISLGVGLYLINLKLMLVVVGLMLIAFGLQASRPKVSDKDGSDDGTAI